MGGGGGGGNMCCVWVALNQCEPPRMNVAYGSGFNLIPRPHAVQSNDCLCGV